MDSVVIVTFYLVGFDLVSIYYLNHSLLMMINGLSLSLSLPTTDNDNCHLHQINGAMEEATVVGDTALVMFEATGPIFVNAPAATFEIRLRDPNTFIDFFIYLCSDSPFTDANTSVMSTCTVDTGKKEYCIAPSLTYASLTL